MRYSHKLAHYHRKPHSVLSFLVLLLTVSAMFLLLSISHTNFVVFFSDVFVSTFRVASAYLLTLPIALLLVLAVSKSKQLENFVVPILDVSQSFPSFAILPPLLFLFGHNSTAIIIFLTTEMIWPLIFTMLSGIHSTRQELSEAATVFGAVGLPRLFHFNLPSLFPSIVTGSIVAWGEAWEAIVGAELLAATTGAGAFIGKTYDSGNSTVFIIAIACLMFFIFILNRLVWLPLMSNSAKFAAE